MPMFPLKILTVLTCLAAISFAGGHVAFAQKKEASGLIPTAKEAPPAPADIVVSPAFRVYDTTLAECMAKVTGVDPFEAARTKNTKGLNVDHKQIMKVQDCMGERGVEVNFENYYAGDADERDPLRMNSTQAAELKAIQEKLDAIPAATVTSPAVGQPAIPMQAIVPVLPQAETPLAVPADAPATEEPLKEPEPAGSKASAPKPARQYWVKPQ